MAKKKDETQEAVAETPTQELVSVQMTEAERDTVVEVLAKKKMDEEAALVAGPAPKEMIVELKFGHRINDKAFGPGRFKVSAEIADLLLYQDAKALESRIQETQSGKHLVQIIGRGIVKAIPVPADGSI